MIDSDTILLIERALGGQATALEWQDLDLLLRTDAEVRAYYLAQSNADLLLKQAATLCPPMTAQRQREHRRANVLRLAACVAGALFLGGISYAAFQHLQLIEGRTAALQQSLFAAPGTDAAMRETNPDAERQKTMNTLQSSRTWLAAAGLAAVTTLNVAAEEAHWQGVAADNNWSSVQNWSFSEGGTSPAGGDLVFGAQDRVASTVANNIVDESITVGSMTYTNSNRYPSPPSGNNFTYVWHVTQINAGQTLTVDGNTTNADAFRIGGNFGSGKHFIPAKVTGPGTFNINAPQKDFKLLLVPAAATGGAILDVTGLSSFNLNCNEKYFAMGHFFVIPLFWMGSFYI